jgi:hypothetical protein
MTDSYHLYLTGTQVFARHETGLLRRRIEPLATWNWDAAEPSSLTFEPLGRSSARRANLHVYTGSALSKFTTMDLPAGLRDMDERRAAAQAHLHQQLGLHAAEWTCTLDPAAPSGKAVICALRRGVIERLRELSGANVLRLVSLRPYVAGVWNAFARNCLAQSALMAIEHDAFTLLVARGGVVESISGLSHRRENDLLEREIKRMAFSTGASAQEHLRLALPDTLLPMAHAHAEKIILKADYLSKAMYPDFRDLLFCAGMPQ